MVIPMIVSLCAEHINFWQDGYLLENPCGIPVFKSNKSSVFCKDDPFWGPHTLIILLVPRSHPISIQHTQLNI